MNRQLALISIIVLLPAVMPAVAANEQDSVVSDSIRIERLAGLCELWGLVKYFHPYPAYMDIDWNEALTKTIPRVIKAETAQDYRRAIEYLLAFLKDPNTCVRDDSCLHKPSRISDLPDDAFYPSVVWTDDSIALIVANDFNRLLRPGNYISSFSREYFLQENARGLVIDIRCLFPPPLNDGKKLAAELNEFLSSWLPYLVNKTLVIPSVRYRVYLGDSDPPLASSGLFYLHGEKIERHSPSRDSLPIVFILNEGSAGLLPLLGGLQAAKQGAIIYEGPFDREGGIDTYEVILPDAVRVDVRLTEIVKSDGTEGVHPDLVIPFTTDTTLLDCPPITTAFEIIRGNRQVPPVVGRFLEPVTPRRADATFDEMSYLKMENRLHGLFRLWNQIRYFYPYRDKAGQSWEKALWEYLPLCRDAKTLKDYNLAIAGLIGRLHDSHADMVFGLSRPPFFDHYPSFQVDLIEGLMVITCIDNDLQPPELSDSSPGLEPGDVILAIDTEDIGLRLAQLEEYLSASTPQAMQEKINAVLFGDVSPSSFILTVRKDSGRIEDIEAKRYRRVFPGHRPQSSAQAYRKLDDAICYIRPDIAGKAVFMDSLDDIMSSRGLIIDLRGRWLTKNQSDIDFLLPFIANRETVCCLRRQIERRLPDPEKYSFACIEKRVFPDPDRRYQGKVAVLIDKTTRGEGERICLYLSAAADVTRIGMPTNGTPGLPDAIFLPSDISPGLKVEYTGVDYCHPDYRPVHGVGILPDIPIEPTIEGIRQGRDELLEAAVQFLHNELKK